jgi:hypothetical protein
MIPSIFIFLASKGVDILVALIATALVTAGPNRSPVVSWTG